MTPITTKYTAEELNVFGFECSVDLEVEWDLEAADPSVGIFGPAAYLVEYRVDRSSLEIYDADGAVIKPGTPEYPGYTAEVLCNALRSQLDRWVEENVSSEDAFEEAAAQEEAAQDAYWDAKYAEQHGK